MASRSASAGSVLLDGALAARNTLEHGDPPPQCVIAIHINQVGARHAMLRNQDGLTVCGELIEQLRRPALQGGDKFRWPASDPLTSDRPPARDGSTLFFAYPVRSPVTSAVA